MTQAGGPAAINGFLYQIIHHLGWLADVALSGRLDGREIEEACLVLEPRSGGDARAEGSGIYLVEQYKTRRGGTWAASDVQSVLRELRKAIPQSRPAMARYRFVTDGRAGRLEELTSFLATVKRAAAPSELDDVERRDFGTDFVGTHRGFFDHIAAVTRSVGAPSTVDEADLVFHLLSHFDMEFGIDSTQRAEAIERLLRRYANNLGDERKVREHLVGVLIEQLSKGESRLDANAIDAMLRHVGLNPERLRKVAVIGETMSALTRRRLARLNYQHGRDVRAAPHWPQDKPVLVIAGQSGAGKSWQLGRLLETFAQEGQPATLVSTVTTTEDVLARAARDLWQAGLGETSDKTLIAVSCFLREIAPDVCGSRLIVAVDDVQDVDLARDLVRQDWTDWDMGLVLAVPDAVARSLSVTDGDAIHVHLASDFSVDELDALLKQKGRRWVDLPPDLKRLLRNPILAGLFIELPYSSIQSAPRSEYEIFEGFWQRIAAKGRPGDEGIVMALAVHAIEAGLYPLPRPQWREIGLDSDDALARLAAAGWLRATENGEVMFAHDRLFNWAVAKSLTHRFERSQLSLDALGTFLARQDDADNRSIRRRLGYVAMDTLWLMAADPHKPDAPSQIVATLEESREFGSYGEDLYAHHLPTLGQRAVPILLERLNALTSESEAQYQIGLIGKAFANLALQENVDLTTTIELLLSTPTKQRQGVAIASLTAAPDPRLLDRLWTVHQQRLDALDDKTDASRHGDYQASFAALRSGVERDPDWLRKRILAADSEKERVSELAYLLNGLEHHNAPAIWKEIGNALMAKVSPSKPRSLLYCIARFVDRTQFEFVVQNLSRTEDFANGAALAALSILDPQAAIERLVEVDETERYMTRNEWLPVLMRAQPELTLERIRSLAESDPKGRRLIELLFADRPDDMDEATLRFLLRMLEQELRERLDEAVTGEPSWLSHSLELLGGLTHPDLLAILEAEAGGDFERMIVAVACSRLRTNSNYRDGIREGARHLLILMGGDGIAILITRELGSEHFWVRHGGLNWAFVRNSPGVVEGLSEIACRPIPRDGNANFESELYREFYEATFALAALGADSALVDAIQSTGVVTVSVYLAELRAHQGTVSKSLTEQALQVLRDGGSTEDVLLPALTIAWLSDDADLIPETRAVLKRSDPEGRVAAHACLALHALGDSSDEFSHLAQGLLHTEKNASWGLDALIGIGERGIELIGHWLQGRNAAKRANSDDVAIRVLYSNPTTRALSVRAAADRCLRGHFLLDGPYDIAAESEDPAIREQILDKAFAARPIAATQSLRAIEGLATFDAMRAVEAIEVGLRSQPALERQLCSLLVRVTPKTAAEKLVDAALVVDRASLRRAAGRTLRRLDPEIVARVLVERMHGSASERKAICELARYITITEITQALGSLAEHDSSREVRYAAFDALSFQRQLANVRTLLAAFPSATPERRWSLLIAILDAADPYLYTDSEDELWLGRILVDSVPSAYERHANSALERRRQKEK